MVADGGNDSSCPGEFVTRAQRRGCKPFVPMYYTVFLFYKKRYSEWAMASLHRGYLPSRATYPCRPSPIPSASLSSPPALPRPQLQTYADRAQGGLPTAEVQHPGRARPAAPAAAQPPAVPGPGRRPPEPPAACLLRPLAQRHIRPDLQQHRCQLRTAVSGLAAAPEPRSQLCQHPCAWSWRTGHTVNPHHHTVPTSSWHSMQSRACCHDHCAVPPANGPCMHIPTASSLLTAIFARLRLLGGRVRPSLASDHVISASPMR